MTIIISRSIHPFSNITSAANWFQTHQYLNGDNLCAVKGFWLILV